MPILLRYIIASWILIWVLPWIKYPSSGVPYGQSGFLISFGAVAVFVLTVKIFSKETPSLKIPLCGYSLVFMFGVFSMLSVYFQYKAYSDLAGLELNEARKLYMNQEAIVDTFYSRLALIMSPVVPFFLIEAIKQIKVRWIFTMVVIFLIGTGILFAVSIGGRFDLLCMLWLCVVGVGAFQDGIIRKYRRLIFIFTPIFIILFFIVNVVFSVKRSQIESVSYTESGALFDAQELISGYTSKLLPEVLLIAISRLDDYILLNIKRLDFYLTVNQVPPAWGQHSFYIFSTKIGFDGGNEVKQTVDSYYASFYGNITNVWATGLRDIIMDFGILGLFLLSFSSGFFYCVCLKFTSKSIFAGHMAVAIVVFMTLSCVVSYFKSIFFQTYFVFIFFLFFADIINGYKITLLLGRHRHKDA